MPLAPPEFITSPLAGSDFSWLAVDDDGHVAWLVTFGSAVVPTWVEEHSDDFADVEDALATKPAQGACVARETTENVEQWRAAARSGLFAYDWDVYSGPYKIVAAPVVPLDLDALPPEIASLARRTHFVGVRFCERPALNVQDVLACQQGAVKAAP